MSDPQRNLRGAIAAGLAFILARQAADGSWTDWALPPGPSTPWTTAYIGLKLSALPPPQGAAPALAGAARWLQEHIFPDGGWGYTPLVGSDADSTAHAILFLASAERPAPQAAYARLAAFQNEDGGFATYRPAGPPSSWNASHPDVTPVALRALRARPMPEQGGGDLGAPPIDAAVARGIDYILRQQTEAGLWHSFWWSSALYSTEANLAFLAQVGVAARPAAGLAEIDPGNAFERSLLLSSLLYAGDQGGPERARALAEQLVEGQRRDGSWESAPVLRITRRDCDQPWAARDAGPLYADPARLFTTAAVIHALGRI